MTAGRDAVRQLVRARIAAAERIVALTGAGISTDSGIPDFRGPQGVWTKNPKAERMSNLQHYLSDPEVRALSWQNRLASPAWTAQPNAGHRALVELQRQGKLRAVVTQNIDELHQMAGSDPDLVIELHGTMRTVRCWSCEEEAPMQVALDRVRAGEIDPPCRTCGGILKSATISFGQQLDQRVLRAAERAVLDCDLLLAIGSSLTVHPAAGLVGLAAQNSAEVVVINAQATPYDEIAVAVIDEPIGEVLPALVAPA